ELVIGETGVVTGDVFTESALVSGKIVGNVTCSAVLHLTSTAKIEGNLLVSAIVVDEGAKIEGSCRTQKTSAQEAAARIVEIPGYESKNPKKREAKENKEDSSEQA
ncbi:MAG: polymer-forming cytoskeletal protein, partial [Clostridiales bacterium]|nr:polymer-forming cytoskeletal protein [Clostridiales bacterium]